MTRMASRSPKRRGGGGPSTRCAASCARRRPWTPCSPGARWDGRAETVPGPPKVSVDNHLSDTHTVVEVKCPDRVGLLYAITRTLSAQGLDIGSARIATEIDQAYDTFYVTDRQGGRVEDPAASTRLKEALEDALMKPL